MRLQLAPLISTFTEEVLLLLKYYPEEKNFECLILKQISKNIPPNRSEQ